MSELAGELPVKVERESGVVARVAARVGKFLSENYTYSGAKAKELAGLHNVVGHFTPDQQKEMRSFFEAKADKNAKWKVIRNWVATGAGLALGGAVALFPEKVAGLVVLAATETAKWWTGTLVPALAKVGMAADKVGAAFNAPIAAAGESIHESTVHAHNVLDYMFDWMDKPIEIPWSKMKPDFQIPPFNPPKMKFPWFKVT